MHPAIRVVLSCAVLSVYMDLINNIIDINIKIL